MIKYVPYVGDSKRAMDEYTSEIFMGGTNTVVLHNTCEDSLLAAPIILDLVIVAEIAERMLIKRGNSSYSCYNYVSILLVIALNPLKHTFERMCD